MIKSRYAEVNATLLGAIALLLSVVCPVGVRGTAITPANAESTQVTDAQIARLKAALKLTPAQEHHWRAVEAMLRVLGHQYHLASADAGLFERTRSRISGYTIDALMLQRVRSAAQPLIQTLSEQQKADAMAVLQSMGMNF
jgi:hypothetical protein